jgi:signal transduction histidine kinase
VSWASRLVDCRTSPIERQRLARDNYGLTGMRERAELLGGTLDAAPTGTGFRVLLRVPAGDPAGDGA